MSDPQPNIIITSEPTGFVSYMQNLWKHRRMILIFAHQEIKVSYAQTKLGLLWLVLKPVLILALFTFVFGRIIKIYPYALFAFSGLFAWNYFSFLVGNGSTALISNQNIIRKIYFPKMVLPFAKALVGLLEAGVSLIILFVLMAIYDFPFTARILAIPLFLLLNIITGLGIALWLNALNLRYRDLNQFIPYIVGFLIWLTPVFYPSTLVPDQYYFFLYVNPMAGIIELYRWAIMNDLFPSIWYLVALAEVLIIFITGMVTFIRVEDDMADYL